MGRSQKNIWKDAETIQKSVKSVASRISKDYHNQKLNILGILRGSLMILPDLVRHIPLDMQIHYINVYYQKGYIDGKEIKEVKESIVYPLCDYRDKHILIVASVLDTGVVMSHFIEQIKIESPKSVKIAVLIDKAYKRVAPINADYVVFEENEEKFVYGYGLDYDERFRGLPDLYYR